VVEQHDFLLVPYLLQCPKAEQTIPTISRNIRHRKWRGKIASMRVVGGRIRFARHPLRP
jgi:hypothetical protein